MRIDDIGSYESDPETNERIRLALTKSQLPEIPEEERRKYGVNKNLIRLVESSNFLSSPVSLTSAKRAFLSNRGFTSIDDGENSISIGFATPEKVHYKLVELYKSVLRENGLYEQKYGVKS
ncbi:MAG: hypothetical protein AABW51_03800 [Nanoarchaeota archaeon]